MQDAFVLNVKTRRYRATRRLTRDDIVHQAKRILSNELKNTSESLTSPAETRDFLIAHLAELEHEVFACIFLDNRHRVISFDKMFNGTIDGASVYPREVVKKALQHNAAAVILAHNHPSGYPEPSKCDKRV